MSTSFNTVYNDMKTSLGLAKKSMLSYFLAGLGMIIVVGIIFVLFAAPIAAVAYLALAPLSEITMIALRDWAVANPILVGSIGVLALIPIVSLVMVVSGSIYGMTYDLVTTGETKAESAFSYLRRKFLTFAGTGAILTIIVILPPIIAWGLASVAFSYIITGLAFQLLTIFTFVWVFVTFGLTAMVFPAVASGKGVQDAVKESFSLTTRYFDRVFGLLSAILLLLLVTFGPMIVWGISQAPFIGPPAMMTFGPVLAALLTWTVVSAFLWILLFLPMIRIAWVKVYQELTGGQVATQSVVNDVPIV